MRFLLITFACLCAAAQNLTIRNVNVVDVTTGAIRPNTNVSIVKGRVSVIGGKLSARSKAINGKGKYLVPGFWDMHVHLWEKEPMFNLYLANGVTAVRDMGSDFDRVRGWRSEITAGKRTGPRIFTSGSPVDGAGPEASRFSVIRAITPEEGRRATDTLDGSGVDFIAVLSGISRDAYLALAQRARVRRAIFVGPVPESVTILEAIDARQRSMEHLFGLAIACSADEESLRKLRANAIEKQDNVALRAIRNTALVTYDEAKCADRFRKMARFNMWQVPTLTLRQRLNFLGVEQSAKNPQLRYIPDAVRKTWQDPRRELEHASPETLEHFKQDYAHHRKLVGLMARTGVGILAGTDTGDSFVLPGFALHDELELLVDAGLSPLQALQSATIQPARYFGIEGSYGSISRAKVADLVLLDGNPLTDIRNTRRVATVVVKGVPYQPRQLLAK